jgi:hypothetical protein
MKNREKKKREKEQRKERWRFRKVQRLEDVLSALGLLQTFRELPARVRAKLAQLLPAKPEVFIEPSALGRPDTDLLKAEIEANLSMIGVETIDDQHVTLSEFYSTCCALPGQFTILASLSMPSKYQPVVRELAIMTNAFYDQAADMAFDLLDWMVAMQILPRSRIDEC